MKTLTKIILILLPLFMLLGKACKAQDLRDTIVTRVNEFIVCKIIKITDSDIEYKKDIAADAIVYEISKSKVRQIRYSNGKREMVIPDEMEMNHEAQIIDKRDCIKVQFFSPLYGHLSFTYETSYKMGTNLEATLGFINSGMSRIINPGNLTQGATLVFGPKFILGESFYMKGMKYSHPLKGRYIKPEIILTTFTVKNLNYTNYNYYSSQTSNVYSNLNVNSVSLMLTYGNQWILGNILTFGYNIGLGYCFLSAKYKNGTYNNLINQNSSNGEIASSYTTYLFNQIYCGSSFPLALTSNITLGYIFK